MSDNNDTSARLKAAVYLYVAAMVEQELDSTVATTPTFIASLVELVYNQLLVVGEDLELFAHHAGRVTINPSDVYMVTRKNPSLTSMLEKFESQRK